MISTGKINQFTGEEIMQVEEHDINWRDVEFEDLTDNEKGDFLSFIKAPFYGKQNKEEVSFWWDYYKTKNLMEL